MKIDTSGRHWPTIECPTYVFCRFSNIGAMLVQSCYTNTNFQPTDRNSIIIGPAYECRTCRTLACHTMQISRSTRPLKPSLTCHIRGGAIKIPPCSRTVGGGNAFVYNMNLNFKKKMEQVQSLISMVPSKSLTFVYTSLRWNMLSQTICSWLAHV